jgi:predicted NUDIX family NTP pyrophosphohydrolase
MAVSTCALAFEGTIQRTRSRKRHIEKIMKRSAGTLLYRQGPKGLEVLLVHPSGNYNRKAPWGIPKGELDEGEDLETAARRETLEETGVEASTLVALGHIVYKKSRKEVHAFAGPALPDAQPQLASWEIDQARFVPLEEARQIIHPDQAVFLDRLLEQLAK